MSRRTRLGHSCVCPSAAVLLAAAQVLGVASAARAGPVEVIFTTIPGHPSANVPGLPGMTFNPGVTTQFDRPYASPSGQRWIIRARLAPPATAENNEVILVGAGRNGVAAVREGSASGLGAGEAYGAIQRSMGINDAGSFVFGARILSGALSSDAIVRYNGGVFEVVAREGAGAPGTGGGSFAAPLDSAGIVNNAAGTPYFRAGNILLGDRQGQSILFRGDQVLAATLDPEFAPADQLNDPSVGWASFEPGRFRMDGAGQGWIALGSLLPPVSGQALAVGNGVVAQEATVIPGDPLGRILARPLGAVDDSISPDGRFWMARGGFSNGQDFVLRDRQIVAATDDLITLRPAETERFDDAAFGPTFFLNLVTSAGDSVVGGVTNAADAGADAVVVLNRQRVVLREGDRIDLNGNGLADDDAFIGVFNNDDAFLTGDLWLYFGADIRNGEGALTGQGLLRVKICKVDWNGFSAVDSADIAAFLSDWIAGLPTQSPLADYDGDGVASSLDISAFLSAWLGAIATGC